MMPKGTWLVAALLATTALAETAKPEVSTEGARVGEWREQHYVDVDLEGDDDVAMRNTPRADDPEVALEPYGHWYDDRDLGRVWRPQVSVSWLPYADGYWAASPWGWTWVSSEPWAWTFHYGSWAWTDAYGWVWLPGTTWGPAWVTWFWADGYVGWTPLPRVGNPEIERFVLVRERDFAASHVRTVAVSARNLPRRVQDGFLNGGTALRRAPEVDQMAQLATQPLHRITERPLTSLAPWEPARADLAARAAVGATPTAAEESPGRPSQAPREPAPGWVAGSAARVASSPNQHPGGWTGPRESH